MYVFLGCLFTEAGMKTTSKTTTLKQPPLRNNRRAE